MCATRAASGHLQKSYLMPRETLRVVSSNLAQFAGLYSRCRHILAQIEPVKMKATATPKEEIMTTNSGRLFVLELSGDRIHSMNPDGSDRKTIVTGGRLPDGVAVDVQASHIYWTNMGVPPLNDGSIERADLDGGNRKVIVPQGV